MAKAVFEDTMIKNFIKLMKGNPDTNKESSMKLGKGKKQEH